MLLYVVTTDSAWTIIVVLVVLLLTFAVFFLLPAGDPALRFAGKSPTPESLALIRQRLGLDQPWYEQFGRFVGNFCQGRPDTAGPGSATRTSPTSPVLSLVEERLPRTLLLVVGARDDLDRPSASRSACISAVKRRSAADRMAMGFVLFGISAPVFWLGLMALLIFWKKLALNRWHRLRPDHRRSRSASSRT